MTSFNPKRIFAQIAQWHGANRIEAMEQELDLAKIGYRWDKIKNVEVPIHAPEDQKFLVRQLTESLSRVKKTQKERARKHHLEIKSPA